MNKSGQVGMEYLVIVGFVTFIVIGILGIAFFYSASIKDRMKAGDIGNFANKITSTAESVFYAGSPSKATISAYLPDNVREIEITGNELIIDFQTSSGINTISFSSDVPMVENSSSLLQVSSGIKKIVIVANASDAVISQA